MQKWVKLQWMFLTCQSAVMLFSCIHLKKCRYGSLVSRELLQSSCSWDMWTILQVIHSVWHLHDVDCAYWSQIFQLIMHHPDWSLSHSMKSWETWAMLQKAVNQRVILAMFIQALCTQHTILEFNNCSRSSFRYCSFPLWRQKGGGWGGQRASEDEDSNDVQRTYMGLCMWHWLFV